MYSKLEFLIAGSEVTRYHTFRTVQTETVGHHSHMVAALCDLLCGGKPSAELLRAALFHDLAEHQLGDIPSPAKKKYGIGEQVNELEAFLLKSEGFEATLTEEEKRILKTADILQGMIFCVREAQLGNKKITSIYSRYRSYADEMMLTGAARDLFGAISAIFMRT